MTLRFLAAGLAAALLASPMAFAKEQTGPIVVAQADTDVAQYLSDTRPLSGLSDKELKQRIRAGRQLIKGGTLAKDDKKKVRAVMQAAGKELKGRGSTDAADTDNAADSDAGDAADDQAGAAQDTTAQPDQGMQPDQGKKKKAAQQTTEESAPSAASGGGAVAEYLADSRTLDSLDDKALRQKLKAGRNLLKNGSLSQADQKKVRQVLKALRTEIKKRGGKDGDATDDTGQMQDQGGGQQPAQGQGNAKTQDQGNAKAMGGGASLSEYLADESPLGQLSEKQLRQRMHDGRELIKGGSLSQADRKNVQQAVGAARLEIAKRGGGKAGQKNTNDDEAMSGTDAGSGPAQKGAGGSAPQVMADATDAAKVDDQALRQRLKAARDQLGSGKLSPDETKALRQKLAADRKELRQRVAKTAGGGQAPLDNQAAVNWLQDKRDSKTLNDRELEGRLAFYRAQLGKNDVTPEQKAQFRVVLDQDRREFRARALASKDDRFRKLKTRVASKQLVIGINIDPPGPPLAVGAPPPPVWAAEADDQMIVTQLVRRPGRKFDRRYTFDEIAAQPELREAMPAVEIDTVTFGFNEDFVREEQLENLDRIGSILEEILAEHPQEVFMIEGHTDAVGDDAYNLDLSRRRAEAVKTALTQYYEISPENLRTVGYGERYLKIDTPDPEEENRRITIRRITPAIGELQG